MVSNFSAVFCPLIINILGHEIVFIDIYYNRLGIVVSYIFHCTVITDQKLIFFPIIMSVPLQAYIGQLTNLRTLQVGQNTALRAVMKVDTCFPTDRLHDLLNVE